jgi:hypothetical protein
MRRTVIAIVTSAIVSFGTACGTSSVAPSRVDAALQVMQVKGRPACVKTHVYGHGYATYQCGDVNCDVRANVSDTGRDYYRCEAQPIGRYGWQRCVVDTHGEMSRLTHHECQMAAWMPGSEIGGF